MSEASSWKATACSSADASEQFLVSEWDSLNTTSQNGDFGPTLTPTPFNIGLLGIRDVHCSSNDGLMEQIPGLSCFNSCSVLEVLGSTGQSTDVQVANCHIPTNSQFNHSQGSEKDSNWRKRKNQPHCSDFESHSPLNRSQDSGSEQQKNVLHGTLKTPTEKDEKKQKNEQFVGANTRKSNLRQAKENPQNGDAPKEDYIHVRAKRGQATNSHSLAERVRREKISERMRFLQNLVPGCNKITGKAVMLDEIINYVQSLQRQVEFLSMKLATVNPELSFDIEQILSKEIHHSQAGSSGNLGFVHGIGSTSPHLHGFNPQALMRTEIMMHNLPSSQDMMKNNFPHVPNTSQALGLWDNEEFQNVFQMGFMSNMHVSSTEPPGHQ